jgi:hypothetical protein
LQQQHYKKKTVPPPIPTNRKPNAELTSTTAYLVAEASHVSEAWLGMQQGRSQEGDVEDRGAVRCVEEFGGGDADSVGHKVPVVEHAVGNHPGEWKKKERKSVCACVRESKRESKRFRERVRDLERE